jgi:hypothetical protein
MDVVGLIANALGAVKEFFGFQSRKLDLRNSAKVQAAAEAQSEIDADNKTEQAIAKQDLKEMRNELAE